MYFLYSCFEEGAQIEGPAQDAPVEVAPCVELAVLVQCGRVTAAFDFLEFDLVALMVLCDSSWQELMLLVPEAKLALRVRPC